MSFSAGQRIEARCTRCKDLTSHMIIVVIDNIPAKVECCACKSIHKYYPPEKKKEKKIASALRVPAMANREKIVEKAAKKVQSTLSSSTTNPTKAVKKQTAKTVDYEEIWKKALAHSYSSPKKYTMEVLLKPEDIVEHITFGTGIVQECLSHDKVSILFKDGIKTLRCKC